MTQTDIYIHNHFNPISASLQLDSIYSEHYLLVVNQIMNIYSPFYYLLVPSGDSGGSTGSSMHTPNKRVTKEEKLIKLIISVDSVNC